MEPIVLPKGIDDPPQLLLWSADEMVPFLGLLFIGVQFRQLLACLLLSVIVIKLFRKFRDNHPDGYLYHAFYWLGAIPLSSYSLVNPYCQRYLP